MSHKRILNIEYNNQHILFIIFFIEMMKFVRNIMMLVGLGLYCRIDKV